MATYTAAALPDGEREVLTEALFQYGDAPGGLHLEEAPARDRARGTLPPPTTDLGLGVLASLMALILAAQQD